MVHLDPALQVVLLLLELGFGDHAGFAELGQPAQADSGPAAGVVVVEPAFD